MLNFHLIVFWARMMALQRSIRKSSEMSSLHFMSGQGLLMNPLPVVNELFHDRVYDGAE